MAGHDDPETVRDGQRRCGAPSARPPQWKKINCLLGMDARVWGRVRLTRLEMCVCTCLGTHRGGFARTNGPPESLKFHHSPHVADGRAARIPPRGRRGAICRKRTLGQSRFKHGVAARRPRRNVFRPASAPRRHGGATAASK